MDVEVDPREDGVSVLMAAPDVQGTGLEWNQPGEPCTQRERRGLPACQDSNQGGLPVGAAALEGCLE